VDWLKNKSIMNLEEEDFLLLPTGNDSNKVEEEATHVYVDKKKKTNERIVSEMRILESWFNPQATKIVDDFDRGRDIVLEQVNLAVLTTSLSKEPSSFEEAINCEKKMIKRLGKKQLKRN
jgi:hypothetical protein